MNDSLLYHLNVLLISDTTIVQNTVSDSNTFIKSAPLNFLEISNINPELLVTNTNFDIITYVIILLLGIVGIIWYTLPDRFLTIFSLKSLSRIQREGDSSYKKPGLFFIGLFWTIYIISFSFFSILILYEFYFPKMSNIIDLQIFKIIITSLIGLFIYRFIIIYGAAFIFQTQKLLKQQVIIDRNIQLITGILLLPISLLIIYTTGIFIFYVVIAAILALQGYRIIQIVIIGNSSVVFSAFHIILYLCALEIVPILILLRLINNGVLI